MIATRIYLDRLPSFCQKLSKSVEIWLSSDKNKSACFFWDTVCVYIYTGWPKKVCEARAASVFWKHPGSRSTPGIGTRSAVYCSPVADIIASHGVRCHQYADDTQLHLAMRVDNTAAGLYILAACTTDVKEWYLQNGLQLNPDKSEALFMGTATQLRAVSSLTSVSIADVDLPVADSMRVFGVTLDRRLTFDNHA